MKKNTIDYQYDSLSRLTREDNQITNKTFVYSYLNNTGGNITSVTEYPYNDTSVSGTTKGYTYSTSEWKDQLVDYDGLPIHYDNIGNPLNWKVGMTNLNWTAGRQLSSLDANNTAISYTYTPGGTRTSKTVGEVKTEYLLDGGLIMQQKTGDEILNFYYDSAGQVVSLGYKATASSPEEFYFVSRNAQGDVVSIYKSADSKLVGTYTYDAWGRPVDPVVLPVGTTVSGGTGISLTSSGDPNGIMSMNPFRYRGYYYDSETGFYYLQSRYYDPEVKRFINADVVDVLSLEYHNINQYNLYSYCNNNPVNDFDENGNLSNGAKIAIGVGLIAAGVLATVLTGGAAAPALIAAIKITAVSTAMGAATGALSSAVTHRVSAGSWEGAGNAALNGAIDGAADGFMTGGIIGGASQLASAGFRTAANMGVASGQNSGIVIANNVKVLSPNSLPRTNDIGGTIIGPKIIGTAPRLDVGSAELLHAHIPGVAWFGNAHLPVGYGVAGGISAYQGVCK